MPLEILARGVWSFGGGVLWHQKLEGQVTKCRWFGLVFYVRENLDGSQAFYISSNERQGEKGGSSGYGRPLLRRNVLDLCTADDRHWNLAADVVRSLDTLHRPVCRHRLFTPAWAESQLRRSPAQICVPPTFQYLHPTKTMGADFLCYTCPRFLTTSKRLSRLRRTIRTLDAATVDEVASAAGYDAKYFIPALLQATRRLSTLDQRRDVTVIHVGSALHWITGGMSWGDFPTEAAEWLQLLSGCPPVLALMKQWAEDDFQKDASSKTESKDNGS